jgi:5-methylcytosine-specific restriction endonuclease McrA
MSHEIPTGEMALVYKAALKIGVEQMMKRKFAATDRPGHSRGSADSRHIPAAVKRAVSDRDQGRCAFVSEAGKRCESRRHLEYDHVEPVARGGQSTVENVRLLCRAHNQHEAERSFGAEFMERKRSEARQRRGARTRARRDATAAAAAATAARAYSDPSSTSRQFS